MIVPGTIGVPCSSTIDSKFPIGLTILEKPEGTQMLILSGEGVAYQRNLIAQSMQGDWVLFIDSDMIPEPDSLMRLLAHGDLDIVHAVCCQRVPPHKYCTWGLDERQVEPPLGKDLFEASGCGMAFTLIRRRVFETMPFPWFEVGKKPDDPTALYEDLWFCQKATKLGFRIWADPQATVWHLCQYAVAPGPDGRPRGIAGGATVPLIRSKMEAENGEHREARHEPAIAHEAPPQV